MNKKKLMNDRNNSIQSQSKSTNHLHSNRLRPWKPIRHLYKFAKRKLGLKTNADLEDLDLNVVRYKPIPIDKLSRKTHFTRTELQVMYRGFKQECPTGIVNEDTFKEIYAQFFPHGDASAYAHYVFNTFDIEKNGSLTFEQFVQGLSVISRGTLHEKLLWIFSLYDVNGDGVITKQDLADIVNSIYDLMGRQSEALGEETCPRDHADYIFEKMDLDCDGVISMGEFMDVCRNDETIDDAMGYFDTLI